jgi:hypothetical protein
MFKKAPQVGAFFLFVRRELKGNLLTFHRTYTAHTVQETRTGGTGT